MNFDWDTKHHPDGDQVTTLTVVFEPDEDPMDYAMIQHLGVFMRAMEVYSERNKSYKDNWKKMGWRGMLVRIRERQERLWDNFWNGEPEPANLDGLDDAIDLINFAGFFVRAVDEGNRDGTWWNGIS